MNRLDSLTYRDGDELVAARGIAVSDETVRRRCPKVPAIRDTFAEGLRRRRARPGDKRQIDAAQRKRNGRTRWLYWRWRAWTRRAWC